MVSCQWKNGRLVMEYQDKLTPEQQFEEQAKLLNREQLYNLAKRQAVEIVVKDALIETLKLEARMHAQEARSQIATVHDIYRLCSGGTGERGNWHGAEPVRETLTTLQRELAEARGMLRKTQHMSHNLHVALNAHICEQCNWTDEQWIEAAKKD
jgi:hypothetical protein